MRTQGHKTMEADYFIGDMKAILTGDESAFRAEYVRMPFKKDAREEKL